MAALAPVPDAELSSSAEGETSEEERLRQAEGAPASGLRLRVLRAGGLLLLGAGAVATAQGFASQSTQEFLQRVSDAHFVSEWLNHGPGPPAAYVQFDNTWCDHGEHQFATIKAAKDACGPACVGVYSIRCNPVYGYALCRGSRPPQQSQAASCTFFKTEDVPPENLPQGHIPTPPGPWPPGPPPIPIDDERGIDDWKEEAGESNIPTDDITSVACKITVFAMMKGMCRLDALVATCPPQLQGMEKTCSAWYSTMKGITEEVRQRKIDRCLENMRRSAQKQTQQLRPASSQEESQICIKCDVNACTELPTWIVAQEQKGPGPQPLPPLPTPPTPPPLAERAPPDGSPNHCRPLVYGQVAGPQIRVRREIHQLNDYDFEIIRRAINNLRGDGHEAEMDVGRTYGAFTAIHPYGHGEGGGPFLPWHRHQLLDLETAVQRMSNNCSVTLPYWNSNLEAADPLQSFVFHPSRYGGQGGSPTTPGGPPCSSQDGSMGYCLGDGIARGWLVQENAAARPDKCERCVHRSPMTNNMLPLPSPAQVLQELQSRPDFDGLNSWLDSFHAQMHILIGGTMGDIMHSPRDPIFFLHHSYTDRLFNWWQRYHGARGVDTSAPQWPKFGQIMRFWNEQAGEWIGQQDLRNGCTLLPRTNPRFCVKYESEITAPERPGGLR